MTITPLTPADPTEAGFLAALATADTPNRLDALLMYADWLGEHGRNDDELTMRWLAKTRCWPAHRERYPDGNGYRGRKVPEAWSYAWHAAFAKGKPSETSILPRLVFLALFKRTATADHKYYSSWQAAVADLTTALGRLREAIEVSW